MKVANCAALLRLWLAVVGAPRSFRTMESVLVLTISGQDRAGLVEQLADAIAAHGGNWEHSRMAHLAGRFVGLLEVSLPEAQQPALQAALLAIADLDVMVARGAPSVSSVSSARQQLALEVVGSDHPGIVRDVFRALAAAGVNVEELSTQTTNAPESGGLLFQAQARLACAQAVDRELIRRQLEAIAHDLMVEVRLVG